MCNLKVLMRCSILFYFAFMAITFPALATDRVKIGDIQYLPRPANQVGVPAYLTILADFESTSNRSWGLGGAPTSFTKTGDFNPPFVRRVSDPTRGSVGEVVFPKTNGRGGRELNLKLPRDPRMQKISFWAKWMTGKKTVTFSIYSDATQLHYTATLPLTNTWKRYRFVLADLKNRQNREKKLSAEQVNNLQFVMRNDATCFRIDDLVTEAGDDLSVPLLSLPSNYRWGFLKTDPVKIRYHIAWDQKQEVPFQLRITHHQGKVWQKEFMLTVKPGNDQFEVDLGLLAPGYYTAVGTLGGTTKVGLTSHFIVSSEFQAGAKSPISLNLSVDMFSRELFRSLAAVGMQRLRVWHFQWAQLEHLRGQFDFDTTDRLAQWAQEEHIELLPILGSTPGWAVSPPSTKSPWKAFALLHRPSQDRELWRQYISRTVKRYKNQIKQWEIWNEPDWHALPSAFYWGNSSDYYRTLGDAYRAAKKQDPSCLIVSGGISLNARFTDPAFTKGLAAAGPIFDTYGFHAYHGWARCGEVIKTIRSRFQNIPLWMTEVGTQGERGTAQKVDRDIRRFVRTAMFFLHQDVSYWSFFILSRDLYNKKGHDLLDRDGSPTAKLAAIVTLARLTRGCVKPTLTKVGTVESFSFQSGQVYTSVLCGPGKVKILSPPTGIIVIDAYGAELKVDLSQPLSISEQPMYLISRQTIKLQAVNPN